MSLNLILSTSQFIVSSLNMYRKFVKVSQFRKILFHLYKFGVWRYCSFSDHWILHTKYSIFLLKIEQLWQMFDYKLRMIYNFALKWNVIIGNLWSNFRKKHTAPPTLIFSQFVLRSPNGRVLRIFVTSIFRKIWSYGVSNLRK